MFRIKIESVGFVEVLQSATNIAGEGTVLVDLGDGFRDRFVTWRIGYRVNATCKLCGRAILISSVDRNENRRWYTSTGQTTCSLDGPHHEPTSEGHREYHAYSGTYHSSRLSAERDYERRVGYRTEPDPVLRGLCDSHPGVHLFRNDPDPCIGWLDYATV